MGNVQWITAGLLVSAALAESEGMADARRCEQQMGDLIAYLGSL